MKKETGILLVAWIIDVVFAALATLWMCFVGYVDEKSSVLIFFTLLVLGFFLYSPFLGIPAKSNKKSGWGSNILGLLMAVLLAFGIRIFAYEPYNIPSGSMFPTLLIGDHLFISKFSYGYSRHSFPFSLPVIPHGRVFEKMPEIGDVVVFRVTPEMIPRTKTG